MGATVQEEPSRQALAEALLDQQRRGTQEDHLQPRGTAAFLVPQGLNRPAPAPHFLDFIQDEEGPPVRAAGPGRPFPMGLDPLGPRGERPVGGGENGLPRPFLGYLQDRRGLPDLPGPDDDLEELRPFREGLQKVRDHRAAVGEWDGSPVGTGVLGGAGVGGHAAIIPFTQSLSTVTQ